MLKILDDNLEMMKKMFFFTLFLVFFGTVCTNAQVTIGDDSKPHPGAVLDLKSNKGLKLPTVDLLNVNVFQLSADQAEEAVGMIIYNTSNATVGGQGKGVYVWDGAKWLFMVVIGKTTGPGTVTGTNGTYTTWCFKVRPGDICWMTQNSMEGSEYYATDYENGAHSGRGYYYTWDQAVANSGTQACPAGWTLPTYADFVNLASYIPVDPNPPSPPDPDFKSAWFSALAGYGDFISGLGVINPYWQQWDKGALWWYHDLPPGAGYVYLQNWWQSRTNGSMGLDYIGSVRCVKPN